MTTDRIAGTTRYGTAEAFAGQDEFVAATTAILATGETFPDALAASGLAGANAPAPIVLTQSNTFTDDARRALAALDSLDDVIIVGGTAAISDDVAAAVGDEGYTVSRVAGTDRYGTAADIAGEFDTVGQIDNLDTALIASGEVFADALAGGPIAYAAGVPILLVNSDGIPAETEAALADLDIEQAIILGGTARISDSTESELESLTGNDAVRVAGQDRFETARLVGETLAIGELGWAPTAVVLANGLNFPDALAAGPFGGEVSAPILLTASIPEPTRQFLDDHSDTITTIYAAGGTAAVSEEDLATAEAAAETTENDTPGGGDITTSAIDAPELQSASVAGVDLDDLAIVYNFVFDEDIDEDTVDESGFKLYSPDSNDSALGDTYNGGDDVDVDGEVVAVTFNLADKGVASATLAAVDEGAVEDEDGNVNPPQSVKTSGLSNSSGVGLVSVEITDEEDGVAEFTFDSPQPPGSFGTTTFQLIARDGTVYETVESADTTPDDDEPSTVVEVDFAVNLDDDAPTAAADTIRRAVTVSAATGRIQAADVSSGSTDGPDLSSIETTDDDDDLDDNEVRFIFDEAIDTSGAAADEFALVYATGCGTLATIAPNAFADPDQTGDGWDDVVDIANVCILTGTAVDTDDDNSRAVIVEFGAADDLANELLVAAQVGEDAGVTSDGGAEANNNDEVQYSTASSLFGDGDVLGPQLIGAELTVDENVFGDFSDYVLTLTFDKDLDDDVAVGDVTYWFQNGEDVDSESLTAADCDYEGDDQIVCEVDDEDSDIQDAAVVSIDAGAVTGATEYDLDNDFLNVQFESPEASIEVDLTEA